MPIVECIGLTEEERQRILSDFDCGVAHLLQVAEMKFGMWTVLPLALCALGHDIIEAARAQIKRMRQQYRDTIHEEHHPLTLLFFQVGSAVAAQVDRFVDLKEDFCNLPLLKKWRLRLQMVRTNELSVERLHRQGTLFADGAPNHSMAFGAFKLRSPDYCRPPHGFHMSELAKATDITRHAPSFMDNFKLWDHPEVQKEQLKIAAKTGVEHSKTISHKVIREVFYHGDQSSMFADASALEGAIAAYNSRSKTNMKGTFSIPWKLLQATAQTMRQSFTL